MYAGLAIPLMLFVIGSSKPGYNQGVSNVHYRIESSLDLSGDILKEHTKLTFNVDSLECDSLFFWRIDLESNQTLALDSVRVNGLAAEGVLTSKDILLGSSPESCTASGCSSEPKDPDSLVFAIPGKGLIRRGVNTIDFFYRIEHSALLGWGICIPEAYAYGEQYPRLVQGIDSIAEHNQRYSKFECFSFRVRIPHGYHFMSECEAASSQVDSNLVEFSADNLRTDAFYWFAFPQKYNYQTKIGSIDIDAYRDPELGFPEEKLREIESSIDFYVSKFGDFPYKKINLFFIRLPPDLGGAAGSNAIFLSGESSPLQRILSPLTKCFQSEIAHEVAHMWWGGGAVSIKEDWLTEGLATYWADQYGISIGKRPNQNTNLDLSVRAQLSRYSRSLGAKKEPPSHYYESSRILHMLALEIGEEAFTSACREFYQKYKWSAVGFAEFKEVVGKYSELSLDSFFTCWVDSCYSQNYSIGRVESRWVDSLYSNELCLERSGKAVSCVPVAVRYEDGSGESFVLASGELERRWESRERVVSVFVDPDGLILEERRFDNVWPVGFEFHPPSLNPIGNVGRFGMLVSSDEPGRHVYMFPEIPSRSLRYGWNYSVVFLGKLSMEDDFLADYFADDFNVLRVGYNSEVDGLVYRFYWRDKVLASKRGWYSWDVFSEKVDGRHESGAGCKFVWFGREGLSWPHASVSASCKMSHRRFYGLEHVGREGWPEWEATPAVVRMLASPFGVRMDFAFERGLRVFSGDGEYYRHSLEISKFLGWPFGEGSFVPRNYFHGRLFLGFSGWGAAQRRFDPSLEGGMESYRPFARYSDRLFAANLLYSRRLFGLISLRGFGGYVSDMAGGSEYEFGAGLLLGVEGLAGVVVDVPAYVSDLGVDGERWSAERVRVAVWLVGARGIPLWEFRR